LQTVDAQGQPLTLALFIKNYDAAKKLAPARFLVLRIHPFALKRLMAESEGLAKVVQFGSFVGHLGKQQLKCACVAAPNGLGDGVRIEEDRACPVNKLEFQIHGATELEVINFDPLINEHTSTAVTN